MKKAGFALFVWSTVYGMYECVHSSRCTGEYAFSIEMSQLTAACSAELWMSRDSDPRGIARVLVLEYPELVSLLGQEWETCLVDSRTKDYVKSAPDFQTGHGSHSLYNVWAVDTCRSSYELLIEPVGQVWAVDTCRSSCAGMGRYGLLIDPVWAGMGAVSTEMQLDSLGDNWL